MVRYSPNFLGYLGGHLDTDLRRAPQVALTDAKIKAAKPTDKQKKLYDEKGLLLAALRWRNDGRIIWIFYEPVRT